MCPSPALAELVLELGSAPLAAGSSTCSLSYMLSPLIAFLSLSLSAASEG